MTSQCGGQSQLGIFMAAGELQARGGDSMDMEVGIGLQGRANGPCGRLLVVALCDQADGATAFHGEQERIKRAEPLCSL
mgnify:CR=1 FL=1